MTVIVSMLLYIFGLDAATGSLNYKCDEKDSKTKCGDGITIDALGNIIIYDPEYNSSKNPVYYNSPNIIIPNPHNNDIQISSNKHNYNPVPNSSSSPAYQS
jgi:hypothetical protein